MTPRWWVPCLPFQMRTKGTKWHGLLHGRRSTLSCLYSMQTAWPWIIQVLLEFPAVFLHFIIFSSHTRFDACTSVIDGHLHAVVCFTFVTQVLVMLYYTSCDLLFVLARFSFSLSTYTTGPAYLQPGVRKTSDTRAVAEDGASKGVQMRMLGQKLWSA